MIRRYNSKMPPKFLLSDTDVYEIISNNRYKVEEVSKHCSRCIDGRYENSADLPALTIPGADIGDLAVLYGSAEQFAFEIDYDKALTTLQELIGLENFSWHTDEHGDNRLQGSGCGHITQLRKDPKDYSLTNEQLEILSKQMSKAQKKGGKETTLMGDHLEGAVLIIKGNYGVLPQFNLQTDKGTRLVQLFIFHQSLVDARHKIWAKKLFEKGAVKLFEKLDDEYLYEALCATTEDHLFETAKRLAKDLPIFDVSFKDDGNFSVEPRGFV